LKNSWRGNDESNHSKKQSFHQDGGTQPPDDELFQRQQLGDINGAKTKKMRVYYDNEADALYIKLGNKTPDGVVEITEGVNLDTTSEDKIVGIEILNASKKINIKTILSYELEVDKKLIKRVLGKATQPIAGSVG
jgi:uncharacterized protein YuzE